MNTWGIVTLSYNNDSNAVQEFFCQRSPTAFFQAFVKMFGKNKYEIFELSDLDLKVYAVKLSFSIEEINSFKGTNCTKLFNGIANWFEMQGVKNIIMPKELENYLPAATCFENFDYGKENKKILLMALTMDILKNISKTKGIDLSLWDLVVVDHQFSHKAVQLIKMLSSRAKCILVITQNPKKAQDFAESQFEEDGLMIHVSGNIQTVTSLSGIYFVMDDIEDVINKCKVGKNKVIFNYTSQPCSKTYESQLLIDGIYISLPDSLKKLSEYIERSNMERFIENFILKTVLVHTSTEKSDIYANVKNSFYEIGCHIAALHNLSSEKRLLKSNNLIDNRQTVVYNK